MTDEDERNGEESESRMDGCVLAVPVIIIANSSVYLTCFYDPSVYPYFLQFFTFLLLCFTIFTFCCVSALICLAIFKKIVDLALK